MPSEWQAVSELPPLGTDEVHIWLADLSRAASEPEIYLQNLSSDEVARASRHKAGQVRMQFVVARACLRVLLGNLMELRPKEVPIRLSAYGKPELAHNCGKTVFFNVAHSRETVLIALCRTGPVGIDIEYLDRKTDALEIAHHSFHQKELFQMEEIEDSAAQQGAFFRCWTRKEAVVKADGRGLSLALASFEVPVLGLAEAAPVFISDGEEAAPQSWFVSDIALGEDIIGAFTAGLPGLIPRLFRFPFDLLPQSGRRHDATRLQAPTFE